MFSEELSDSVDQAFKKLVDYLARRDHSVKELKEKLSRRFTGCAIESALEEAANHKYLTDPKELAECVAKELHQKNKGFYYIQNYLLEKGLPEVALDSELETVKAQSVVDSKISKRPTLTNGDRSKLEQHLKNRGFDLETIETVIKQIKFSSPKDEE